MADKNSSKNNFIMQAGILAAAGIISRIIGAPLQGALYRVSSEIWDLVITSQRITIIRSFC